MNIRSFNIKSLNICKWVYEDWIQEYLKLNIEQLLEPDWPFSAVLLLPKAWSATSYNVVILCLVSKLYQYFLFIVKAKAKRTMVWGKHIWCFICKKKLRYPKSTIKGPLCSCLTKIKIRRRSKPVVSMWESSTTQRVNNISVFCHQHWPAPDHISTLKLGGQNCSILIYHSVADHAQF